MDVDGIYLTFTEFGHKFPNVRTNVLTYRGVIDTLPKYQQNIQIIVQSNNVVQETKVWTYIQGGNKKILSKLLGSDAIPAGGQRWIKI